MQSGFDIGKLYEEARIRWLKPAEVLFILQNHGICHIHEVPPNKPPSGSLFLFNRRVLRFFRKDGHVWRRKKDGRTVGEAHERLKVGNVDALNCYYAHGEQNHCFQRRSYWMLDPAYDHIVLVHYRELDEERYIPRSFSNLSMNSSSVFIQSTSFSNTQNQRTSELNEPYQAPFSPGSVEEVSSKSVVGNNKIDQLDINDISGNYGRSSQPQVNQAVRVLAVNDDDKPVSEEEKLAPYPSQEELQGSGLTDYERRSYTQDILGDLPQGLGYKEHDHYFYREPGKQDNLKGTMLFRSTGGNQKQQFLPSGSEYLVEEKGSPSWKEMLELNSSSTGIDVQEKTSKTLGPAGFPESSVGWAPAIVQNIFAKDMILNENDMVLPSSEGENISVSSSGQPGKLIRQQLDYRRTKEENHRSAHQISDINLQLQLLKARNFLLGPDHLESPPSASLLQEAEEPVHNIFGTESCYGNSKAEILSQECPMTPIDWMGNMHIVVDNNSTYSTNYSEMFDHSQFEAPLGADSSLTLAQKQQFIIREISPEWAFASESTKVIITGDFLCDPSECAWTAMFGDVEVNLEIIQQGVLRCQAPPHVAGMVTLCVTSGNRESCSEVREFEYRLKPETSSSEINLQRAAVVKSSEELLLLTKFVQMLLCGCDTASVPKVENAESEIDPSRKLERAIDQWDQVIESISVSSENPFITIDWLLEELLKDKLQQWLPSKNQVNEDTGCSLSKPEQGIIHMISGLGYEWALNPILNCGVGVNFRDSNGWTALHWAARFGREKMVATLLAAGALAGAVTDPTALDPSGKTPASISAISGYKGLAGYLSEVALTSHLSSLTLEEIEISKGSAELEAERAVESISQRNIRMCAGVTEDQLSLKDSLAAVRNAKQAATRIQSAFRAHSFRKKQQKAAASRDEYGMTPEEVQVLSAALKFHGHRDQQLHTAALCIQRKYLGWKGRKTFLTLRQHIVKIQAHVRGHQVRKKYREFLWTVSVLEKVILRWRRRGVGLRGFRAELEPMDEIEGDDILKIFRKQKVDAAVDECVSRVLSMVESPGARHQYRRMLECYRRAKAKLVNASEAVSSVPGDGESKEVNDVDMYQLILDDVWAHLDSPTVNLRKL